MPRKGLRHDYYPVFLNLAGSRCVVVGGGRVAERKVRALLKTGARITLISPEITRGLERLTADGRIRHKLRPFRSGDTRGAFLVVAATSDDEVNRKIASEAGGLVNVADRPELCGFISPSVINRGALTIAVSTSGVSPAFSKTLRKELERLLPSDVEKYLELLRELRPRIIKLFPASSEKNARQRTNFLRKLGGPEVLKMLERKGFDMVKGYIDQLIRERLQGRVHP
jgi:precorrin-2 dehydrogenase/sirohydrochlorin ferrochelatase